jgi:LAS superfamily LD-carboxypeptidase LdcB
MRAPREIQQQEAAMIPLVRFGPGTQRMIQALFGRLDKRMTRGELAKTHGTHPFAGGAADNEFLRSRASSEVSGVNGLNPEFADDLKRATSAAEAATGQRAAFTSLTRSFEKQDELYYNFRRHIGGQGIVAPSGTSLHEKGMAADLASGPVRDWVRAHAGQYGMELVPGDPEHVQLAHDRQIAAVMQRDAMPHRPITQTPEQVAQQSPSALTQTDGSA